MNNSAASQSQAVVQCTERSMPCSALGPSNAFPKFSFEYDDIEIFPDDSLTEKFTNEMFRYGIVSLFPYTVQED